MDVKELMSRDVVSVAPETPLKDVARLLVERGIGGVPVRAADGRVLGVLSESDIVWKELRTLPEAGGILAGLLSSAYGDVRRERAATAGEAMSSPAITIGPDASVATAARLMIEHMVNRVPVVNEGRLVGVLARSDIVRAFARSDEQIEIDVQDALHELWIDPASLSVTVEGGAVGLAGEVENHSTAVSIERHIARIPGVLGVCSELRWQVDDTSRRVAAAAERGTHSIV